MQRKIKDYQKFIRVGILFLINCFLLSGCGGISENQNDSAQKNGQDSTQILDVWFFACSEDADSILLRTPAADVMIDTGIEEDSEQLIEKLRAIGVDDVELLVLTHPDKDHIGGVVGVLNSFPVEQVVQTACVKGSELQKEMDRSFLKNPGTESVQIPQEIQKISFGELQLTIYPPQEDEYKNANNYSIGVLAEFDGTSFFFAGDAKKKRIKELLGENLPDVDVYKVAHHGRDNGASEELIGQLKPEYAVVTAQQAEEKTTQAFRMLGTKVYSSFEKDVHFSVKDGILDVG